MKKFSIYFLLFIFLTLIAFFLVELPVPPKSLQKEARVTLNKAKSVRAEQLAPNSFNNARIFYDSAMFYWGIENERFILFRDYTVMQSYLEQSVTASQLSYIIAKNEKKLLSESYGNKIAELREMFSLYDLHFTMLPLNTKDSKILALAKLQFEACILSIENKQVAGIDKKLGQVQETIESLTEKSKSLVTAYFEDYNSWEKLRLEAIKHSKQNSTGLIIVDKYHRKCMVYQRGNLESSFTIELGSNWIGDKLHSGDKTTPEGNYKILTKKAGGQTKFYKAFLLNYPNDEDLKRYQKNKKNGVIAKNVQVGGDIEIHGMGGKGSDWTDGCVALANRDMDKLFDMVTVGTPVVIVGSTQPLNIVLRK